MKYYTNFLRGAVVGGLVGIGPRIGTKYFVWSYLKYKVNESGIKKPHHLDSSIVECLIKEKHLLIFGCLSNLLVLIKIPTL